MPTKCLGKITQFFRPNRPEVARKMAVDGANAPLKNICFCCQRDSCKMSLCLNKRYLAANSILKVIWNCHPPKPLPQIEIANSYRCHLNYLTMSHTQKYSFNTYETWHLMYMWLAQGTFTYNTSAIAIFCDWWSQDCCRPSVHSVKYLLSNLLFLQGFTDHALATILTARDKCYTLPQTAPSSSSCPHAPLCHLHEGRPVASANLHTSESLQVCLSTPQVLWCNYLTAYCLPHLPGLSVQENSWSLPSDKRTNLIPCWTPYAPLDAFGGSSNIAAL